MKKIFAYILIAFIWPIFGFAEKLEKEKPTHFAIKSDDNKYSLKFSGLLQTLAKFEKSQEKNDFDFSLRRARLGMSGSILDPMLTFGVKAAFEKEIPLGFSEGKKMSIVQLHDYYVDLSLCKKDRFHLKAGKFALPFFGKVSSSKTQFLDPFLAQKGFGFDSGIGVMVHGSLPKDFDYGLAVVQRGLVGRVAYNHGNIDVTDAVAYADDAGFSLGVNGALGTDYSTKFDDNRAGVDYLAKYKRFSSNGAFYYQRKEKDNNFGVGFDAGYLLIDHLEPVARYSMANTKKAQHEAALGLNYYIIGHNLKVQVEGGASITDKFGPWHIQTDLQLAF